MWLYSFTILMAVWITNVPEIEHLAGVKLDIPTINLVFLAFIVGVYYNKIRKMEKSIAGVCATVTKLHDEHISCFYCHTHKRAMSGEIGPLTESESGAD